MPLFIRSLPVLAIMIGTTTAVAHPGHGVTDPQTITHQVTEPVHAIPWMLLIGIGVTLAATAALIWKRRAGQASAVAVHRRTPVKRG